MAKPPEQVLIIEPRNELRFRGPFTGAPVTSYIKLINPTSNKVYFKIKTTAPKRYCVRPNAGYLKPKEVSEIAVSLQPYDFDPTEKNKHKFMVQTLIAPDGDTDEFAVNDVWKDVTADKLMDSKLKCVFENPVSNTATSKTSGTTPAAKPDANVTNGKNKGVGDSVKTSSKPMGETEEKLLKAAQEVNQLRVEESNLRQENLQLREEMMKLRSAAAGKDAHMAVAGGLSSHTSHALFPTTTSIIIAIAMVITGYLLGKLI